MPPRILIFTATTGSSGAAAAGAACELAEPGTARALTLDLTRDPVVRTEADRIAGSLDLRPVAAQLAVLCQITALLRERADATIALDAGEPSGLLALIAAADLARARLDAARPAAGVSTLAATRQGADADLPVLRDAAIAGDLLRAPEITLTGITGAEPGAVVRSRLALAGLTLTKTVLPDDPDAAAGALARAHTRRAGVPGAAPLAVTTAAGADLTLQLPGRLPHLRAVRSGEELVISDGSVERRVRAPRSLGRLTPAGLSAGDDGALVGHFEHRTGAHAR